MGENEKIAFYDYWKTQTLFDIEEKLENDSDLEKMVEVETLAFEQALEDSRGARFASKCDYERFNAIYETKLHNLVKKIDLDSSARGGAFFTTEQIVPESELV